MPLATLARAVKLAQPGDTILLAPGDAPVHQSLVIASRSGAPGKPIIFDGQGRTLIGTRALDPTEWQEIRPGVYRSQSYLADHVKPGKAKSAIARCFMVFGGKVQNMGLTDKLNRPALPSPDALAPGEWTYAEEEKAFYLAIPPHQKLADAAIELPHIQNGVSLAGDVAHWEIRNVKVHRFINDGFNFHGKSRDILLEDIAATECSDDGMSAHGECQVTVRRFTAERNATGICHINQSSSENSEVTLRNNIGPNLYLLGSGTHTFKESHVSALGKGVRLGSPKAGSESGPLTVRLIRTVIEDRDNPAAAYNIQSDVQLKLEDSPTAEVGPTAPRLP